MPAMWWVCVCVCPFTSVGVAMPCVWQATEQQEKEWAATKAPILCPLLLVFPHPRFLTLFCPCVLLLAYLTLPVYPLNLP